MMNAQGSAGPGGGPTGEDGTDGNTTENLPEDFNSWLLDWLADEDGDGAQATTAPGPAEGPPLSVFDRNFTDYPEPEFLRAAGIHEEALNQGSSSWAALVPPRTPEEMARDQQQKQLAERQESMYLLVDDMAALLTVPFEEEVQAGRAPQGAERSAAQLFDVWQRHFDSDRSGERLSLDGVTPQAVDAYLCLVAVRCTGAPPEATIHAGAALANLLHSNEEMTDEGHRKVLDAAHDGMDRLDLANQIAGGYLPDARLAVTGDPVRDRVIQLTNAIAPNPAAADVLASRFLPWAHAAGPDGTPRTDPLPGTPTGFGTLGVSGRELRAWDDRTISPVELASLEAGCHELARLICETGYGIPGSSAGPNVLASPERQANLGALNGALSEYWGQWQADQRSTATAAAWDGVLKAQEDLDRSMRESASRSVPSTGDPAQVSPAQPGRVAQLTSDAQSEFLGTLYSNLPSHAWPDGVPVTFTRFTESLLGPRRVENQDYTFPLSGGQLTTGTGAPTRPQASGTPVRVGEGAPPAAPTDDRDDTVRSPDGSAQSPAPSRDQGRGVVYGPHRPEPHPDLDPNRANGDRRPEPTEAISNRPTPPVKPDLPPLGGFNDGPQPTQVPNTTASPRPDTSGLDWPFTEFPLGPEELPPPATTPATAVAAAPAASTRQPVTRPIPSNTDGRTRTDGVSAETPLTGSPALTNPPITTPPRTAPAPPTSTPVTSRDSTRRIELVGNGSENTVPGWVETEPHPTDSRLQVVTVVPALRADTVTTPDGSFELRNTATAMVPEGARVDLHNGPVVVNAPVGARLVPATSTELVSRTPAPPAPGTRPATRPQQVTQQQPVTSRQTATPPRPVIQRSTTPQRPPTPQQATTRAITPQQVTARPQPVVRQQPVVRPRPVTQQPQPVVRQQPAPQPAPQTRPVTQPQPVTQPNLIQQGQRWVDENIGAPLRAGYEQGLERAAEIQRTTISSVQALDGVMGFGVDEYLVTFANGSEAVYNPKGQQIRINKGNPPSSVSAWQLPLKSVEGGGIRPAPAGAGQPVPRLSPIMIR